MDPKNSNPTQPANPNQNTPITPDPTNILANSLPQITPVPKVLQTPPIPPQIPNKPSKLLLLVPVFLIVILVALIAMPVTLAYNNYKLFTPPVAIQKVINQFIAISPLPKTPNIILSKTQQTITSVKSANIENTFEASTEEKTSPIKSASITISGPVDFRTQHNSNISMEISGSVAMEGLQLSGSGSLRKINNNLYFRINSFPAASLLPVNELKNQWFYMNIDQLQGKNDNDTNKIFQDLKPIFSKYLIKSADWSQKTEDKTNYYLKIKPPKEETNNIIFDVLNTLETDTSTNLEKNIQKDNLKEFTDKLENFEINAKIDKKTYLLNEINLEALISVQAPSTLKQTGAINLSPANQVPIKVKYTSKFTKYNEPVIVEIPEGAIDLKKIIDERMKTRPQFQQIPPVFPFTKPPEATLQAKPKDQSGFKNLLENSSPVLGSQNTNWDELLLEYLNGI